MAVALQNANREELAMSGNAKDCKSVSVQAAILTGGGDRPYALGLAEALIAQGVSFDFIASDELDDPKLHRNALVRFLNLRKEMRSNVSAVRKVVRMLLYYWRLLFYAATAKPKLFRNPVFQQVGRTRTRSRI